MARVLIIGTDDQTSAQLRASGHETTRADVQAAMRWLRVARPDLVLLDVEPEREDGLSLCGRLRRGFDGPIVMLSLQSSDTYEVQAFERGADAFLRKPVKPRVLSVRIRALLRSFERIERTRQTDPDLVVDARRREVRVAGAPVAVTTAEFELLRILVNRAGSPVSRQVYFQQVRGTKYDGFDRTFDKRMSRLRQKLVAAGLPPSRLATVRGVGYQLMLP